MTDYTNLSDQELLDALLASDTEALAEACKRCGYQEEYERREQVIDGWPHEDKGYDKYTHQGLINYTDSILIDLCVEWLKYKIAAPTLNSN